MQEKKSELDKTIDRLYSYYKVYTDTALSKKMNVSRSAISQWRYKGVIPKKILSKYDQVISGVRSNSVGVQEQVVVENQPIHITKGEEPVDASYIIDLQKDKIEHQAIEIDSLKDALQKKQAESTHWESLEYDFICNVKLFREGFRFGRIINSVTGFDKQIEVLGYTKDEMKSFWDIGVKHTKLSEHPIEAIIDEETQKDIQKHISILPVIFDAMKATVGDHYIPQPVVYIHKQGHHIGAISYNKVVWSSLKVTAKVKFLID